MKKIIKRLLGITKLEKQLESNVKKLYKQNADIIILKLKLCELKKDLLKPIKWEDLAIKGGMSKPFNNIDPHIGIDCGTKKDSSGIVVCGNGKILDTKIHDEKLTINTIEESYLKTHNEEAYYKNNY